MKLSGQRLPRGLGYEVSGRASAGAGGIGSLLIRNGMEAVGAPRITINTHLPYLSKVGIAIFQSYNTT